MPIAKRLPILNRPPCQGRVSEFTKKFSHGRGRDPGACQMRAVYRIGRRRFCDHHARQLALHLLLTTTEKGQET